MMVRLLYVITLLCAALAALLLLIGFVGAKSAPQEAAAAAGALALAVIPYVFTRCVQLSNDYGERRESTRKLVDLLEEANRLAEKSQQK